MSFHSTASKNAAPARTFRITTLGCRVNHAESREIASILRHRGFEPAAASETPSIEVVHSCSVTSTAARKSRSAARRASRQQNTIVFLTGCYVSTHPEQAAAVSDRAVPHESGGALSVVQRFARELDAWLQSRTSGLEHPGSTIRAISAECSAAVTSLTGGLTPLRPTMPREPAHHARAELKIQDGCDAHCTFCVIPKIRRTLRSKAASDAVDEARRLVDLGHREIVLTGIFIGAYGHETALRRNQANRGAQPLADLVDAVASVRGLARLRISSMEPMDVTDALLDAMVANAPVVVPHLHLPLQSGSDAVLKRMNRQYRIGEYLDMIGRVNEALTVEQTSARRSRGCLPPLPPAITTDIICGFPGETDQDFERTVSVAERVAYLHMHVFPFSPRVGTAAARWKDRFIDPATVKERVRTLIHLEEDRDVGLSIRFRRRLIGRTVRVILEQPDANDRGFMTGRCDHYALIHVPTTRGRSGLIEARIEEANESRTIGVEVGRAVPLPVLASR